MAKREIEPGDELQAADISLAYYKKLLNERDEYLEAIRAAMLEVEPRPRQALDILALALIHHNK